VYLFPGIYSKGAVFSFFHEFNETGIHGIRQILVRQNVNFLSFCYSKNTEKNHIHTYYQKYLDLPGYFVFEVLLGLWQL